MKTFPIAVLFLTVATWGLASCSPKKSLTEELTDKLLDRVGKEAQKIDPKRMEAEIARLTNNLTPAQKEKAKQEARRILDRL